MLADLKRNNKNVYTLLVALAVSCWFEGITRIIRTFVPIDTKYTKKWPCNVFTFSFNILHG